MIKGVDSLGNIVAYLSMKKIAFITYEMYCKYSSEYTKEDKVNLDNIFEELDNQYF